MESGMERASARRALFKVRERSKGTCKHIWDTCGKAGRTLCCKSCMNHHHLGDKELIHASRKRRRENACVTMASAQVAECLHHHG